MFYKRNTDLKDKLRDSDIHSVKDTINKSHTVHQGQLDSLKERAHNLIKKLALLYKEASKIDKAYEGTLSLMKNWVNNTNSDRREHIEQLLESLSSMADTHDIKIYNEKLHNHKKEEMNISNACTSGLRLLIEVLDSDIENISKELINKSKKLSMLKVEMDKVEPGKQIPAELKVVPDLP